MCPLEFVDKDWVLSYPGPGLKRTLSNISSLCWPLPWDREVAPEAGLAVGRGLE